MWQDSNSEFYISVVKVMFVFQNMFARLTDDWLPVAKTKEWIQKN